MMTPNNNPVELTLIPMIKGDPNAPGQPRVDNLPSQPWLWCKLVVSLPHSDRCYLFELQLTNYPQCTMIENPGCPIVYERLLRTQIEAECSPMNCAAVLYDGVNLRCLSADGNEFFDQLPNLVQVLPYDYDEFDLTFLLDCFGNAYARGSGKSMFFDTPSSSMRPIERICKNLPPVKQLASNGASALYLLTECSKVFAKFGLETDYASDLFEGTDSMTLEQLQKHVGLPIISEVTNLVCPEGESIVSIFSTRNVFLTTSETGNTYITPVEVLEETFIPGEQCHREDQPEEDEDDDLLGSHDKQDDLDVDDDDDLCMNDVDQHNHYTNCTCRYDISNSFGEPIGPYRGYVVNVHEFLIERHTLVLLNAGNGHNSSFLLLSMVNGQVPRIRFISLDREYANMVVWYVHGVGAVVLCVTQHLEVYSMSLSFDETVVGSVTEPEFLGRIMRQDMLVKSAKK